MATVGPSVDVFNSPAVSILCELERDGFRVELDDGGTLVIAPRSRLTADRMRAIRDWKAEIRTLVYCCEPGVQDRRDAFRRQLEDAPQKILPALLYRAGVPFAPGRCYSCDDHLPELLPGRCWRCSLAARLACRLPIPVGFTDGLKVGMVRV